MAASEIVTPRPSTSGDRAQPWLRSRRHAVTMSLLAIVALTALGATAATAGPDPRTLTVAA
jgi:hypothetical protein